MGEFSEKDVCKGLRVNATAYDDRSETLVTDEWELTNRSGDTVWFSTTSRSLCFVTSARSTAENIRRGLWTVAKPAPPEPVVAKDRSSKDRDRTPPTQRSGRRFDGVTVRCKSGESLGELSWDPSLGMYRGRWRSGFVTFSSTYDEKGVDAAIACGLWQVASEPPPEPPRHPQSRWDGVRLRHEGTGEGRVRQMGDTFHVGFSTPYGAVVENWIVSQSELEQAIADGYWKVVGPASTASALSPREASRRAIDETMRGLRGQPFARAIQAVLVSACTEGKTGERILSRDDIDSMVAACRAWEECRGKVAPGRSALTPEQTAKCWEAATKAGLWLGGSGEVYERARSL